MTTIFDVAAAAGVSHQTVSRVLNGDPRVRERNRKAVLAAAASLGYRPNAAARALARRRSGMLGMITADAALFGPSSVQRAFAREAGAAGFIVLSLAVEQHPQSVSAAFEVLLLQRVQAIVLVSPSDTLVDGAREVGRSIPVLSTAGRGGGTASVVFDQRAGGRLASTQLIDGGRVRIGHLAGPDDWWDARERQRGWREALDEAGLAPGPCVAGDWSAASGAAAARALVDAGCDAIVSANDTMAIGALHELAARGIRVPDDVALIGHDDMPESAFLTPALTTVRHDHAALGTHLMAAVRASLDGGEPAPSALAPSIVLRATHGREGRSSAASDPACQM